jgi:glutamyl-tRNA synthetase
MPDYVGRFAPSPTGSLHLGSLAASLVAWLAARQSGGRLFLRVEDLDQPRLVAGMVEEQMADLRWLGLDWDEGPDTDGGLAPYTQSEGGRFYDAALERLREADLLYYCDCSRREIAGLISAPHPGEGEAVYPGRCRSFGLRSREFRRPPAIRLAVPEGRISGLDRWQGPFSQDVAREVGDFVLRRGDGVTTYQLAVVVDDLRMGITEVVRGADLLSSAPRQILLAQLLGGRAPSFAHLPMVVDSDGQRLAKRNPRLQLRDRRAAGERPFEVLMEMANFLGLLPAEQATELASLDELVACADLSRLRGLLEVSVPAAFGAPEQPGVHRPGNEA